MSRPKDHPEQDVNVQAVHGFDVTSLSVEDLRAAGVVLHGSAAVVVTKGEHPFYMSHSAFLADVRPTWDLADRSLARAAVATHARHVEDRLTELRAVIARPDTEAEAKRRAEAEVADLEANPLRGLVLVRSFPCLGTLRVESATPRVRVVQCDVCGHRFGVAIPKEEREPADDSSTTTTTTEGEDKWPF